MPLRRVLKKTAIPTLNLNDEGENNKIAFNQTPSSKRPNERSEEHHLVDSKLMETTIKTEKTTENITKELTNINPSVLPSIHVFKPSLPTFKKDDVQPSIDYKQKYDELLLEFKQFKRDSREKLNRTNKMLKYYKKKYYSIKFDK